MKKRLFTLSIALTAMCVSMMGQIYLTKVNFPDEKFLLCLGKASINKDNNEYLDASEINAVTELDVSNKGIKDLTGIEHFTKLTSLNCSNNALTSLDISNLTELSQLACYGNDIKGEEMEKLIYGLPSMVSASDYGYLTVCDDPSLHDVWYHDNVITIYLTKIAMNKDWKVYQGATSPVDMLVQINESNFSDQYFRNSIKQFDTDNDGYFTIDERKAVTGLRMQNSNAVKADGIRFFTELETVLFSGAKFKGLDVTANKKLRQVNCQNCSDLLRLTVSKNATNLSMIAIEGTKITGTYLDDLINSLPTVAKGTLYVDGSNAITSTQIRNAVNKGWNVMENNGEYVPLGVGINEGNFPDEKFRAFLLAQSYGSDAYLTKDELESVYALGVNGQGIKDLTGIEYFTEVTNLNCSKNELTSLDVSKNVKLITLSCYGNSISGTNMDNLINGLPTVAGFLLALSAECSTDNAITTTQVANAKKKLWTVQKYDPATGWKNYAGFDPVPINEDNFPDPNFRKIVAAKAIDTDADGYLSEAELKAVTNLNLNNKGIARLKGIEHFRWLTQLDCSKNNLLVIDISSNTSLQYLFCENNGLEVLDLSENKALLYLYCTNNKLTSLDLSANTKLTSIGCSKNMLTTLDFSANTKLTEVYIDGNQISGTNMDNLINSLPYGNDHFIYVCNDESVPDNTLTVAQALKLRNGKGWRVQKANYTDYAGFDPIEINATNFPDEKFRTIVAAKNIDRTEDGKLAEWELRAVKELSIGSKSIASLTGIGFFTALEKLYASYNNLTALDVSKNKKLTLIAIACNTIGGAAMDQLVNSLPNVTDGALYVNTDDNMLDNVITAAQIAVATGKGWKVKKTNASGSSVDYAGLGDVNGDNKIDQNDLDTIVNIIMGQAGLGYAGDLNNDGKTDAKDIVVMVNILKSLKK